jgi:hypothetical protein
MRRLAAIAAVAILAGACTELDEPAARPAATFTEPAGSVDDINVEIYRSLIDGSDAISDADIVDFGENVCSLARGADSGVEFLALMVEANAGTGLSDHDAGEMIGAALGLWCPDQAERLGLF